MHKRRPDTLSDLRRQRERLRRIGIGAMLAAGLVALGSCEQLTRRDATPMQGAAGERRS
jgi:ferric-dicitrate binding protein FerR (iron transport regulator)